MNGPETLRAEDSSEAGSNELERPEPGSGQAEGGEPGRPFRLVKYFSLTGFLVILVFTLALTLFISSQAKTLALSKSEAYADLLCENLNHQVFLQFVLPIAYDVGRISLRDQYQYSLLDTVVRNTIHSLNVSKVNLWDLQGNLVYSTDREGVGETKTEIKPYKDALEGKHISVLEASKGEGFGGFDRSWTLKTFIPFRGEKHLRPDMSWVLGVFEVHQDLTRDYSEITRFQWVSLAISLTFCAFLFIILRRILARGEAIIEQRNDERRRLQEKLHQTQRLANLGQMVAAVSHEIRNPLGIISSTAEILSTKFRKYEPDNRLAGVIVEESRRLNGIVTEFLDFARPEVPKIQACAVEDILEDILDFLTPSLEQDGIEVARDFHAPDPIEADPDLLYRALLNVFINAVQAMPEGGLLAAATRLPYNSDGQGLGMLEIAVSDTGEGIDPAIAEEVFTPFFTTKNRGSGLGLAIVKNIVDGHKWEVAIGPGEDGGTRTVIRLPLRQD